MAVERGINLADKFSQISEYWSPGVVARINDYDIRLVKLLGEFVWHRHADTDELFLVLDGHMRLLFRDREVALGPGELYVVPRGVEHKPVAEHECRVLLLEPSATVNTGDNPGDKTSVARWL